MKADFKCGFVVIVGKPNVGKSTLLNKLVGEKLSITSDKPQTTRLSLKGIYNDLDSQIVFLDTPGYLKPRYEMHHRMLKQVTDTLKDADLVIFLTDKSDFPTEYDNELMALLKSVKRPQLALINKSDLKGKIPDEEIINKLQPDFEEVFFISALQNKNLKSIIPAIIRFLPLNPPFYDLDQLSDLPMRFFAQESIREGIFHQYEQEIPYATAVVIDKYEELAEKTVIHATIWIERDSQKPILIGTKGSGLRRIREYAEKNLTEFNQMHTEIHLWVKIKHNWRKNPSALRELGFK